MATLGKRILRSPLNPLWSLGQGMRGVGQLGYAALPAMSRLGDSLVDSLAKAGIGEQAGNLGAFLAGNVGKSIGQDSVGGVNLADLGRNVGSQLAAVAPKMAGRGLMGGLSEAMLGGGSLLSGGGEPGDMALRQGALYGAMPKMDLAPDKGVPPPAKPIRAPLNPLAGEGWAEEKAYDQPGGLKVSMSDGPDKEPDWDVDDAILSAADFTTEKGGFGRKPGQGKKPILPPATPSGPGVPKPGMYTSPDGGMVVGPATIIRPPPDVSMDAEPTIMDDPETPLATLKQAQQRTVNSLVGRPSRRPARVR